MKTLLLFCLALVSFNFQGQFSTLHTVDTNQGIRGVLAVDIDGDGDNDIVTSISNGNSPKRVVWYENNGEGEFLGNENVISENFELPEKLWAGDLNGDNTVDLIVRDVLADHVLRFDNDGAGNFGEGIILEFDADLSGDVTVVGGDVDGDNDIDLIFSHFFLKQIFWKENDGLGNFTVEHEIVNSDDIVYPIWEIRDFNFDGDLDLILVYINEGNSVLQFYEGTGFGNFYVQSGIVVPVPSDVNIVNKLIHLVDIDNDNDLDVVLPMDDEPFSVWIETESDFTFGEIHEIPSASYLQNHAITAIETTDVDSDGDNDIIAGYRFDNRIIWYENMNNGDEFIGHDIVLELLEVRSLDLSDIDGDGDLDLVSGSSDGLDDIYTANWHEKDGNPSNIEDLFNDSQYLFSPNPMQTYAELIFTDKVQNRNVLIYSSDGKLVRKYITNEEKLTIHKEDLVPGIYFASVLDNSKNEISRLKLVILE